MIDDESLVKTRTNTCLSYTSAVPSYSVILPNITFKLTQQLHPPMLEYIASTCWTGLNGRLETTKTKLDSSRRLLPVLVIVRWW